MQNAAATAKPESEQTQEKEINTDSIDEQSKSITKTVLGK